MAVRVTGYTGGSRLSVREAAVFSAMIKKHLMEVNSPLLSNITGHYTKSIVSYKVFTIHSAVLSYYRSTASSKASSVHDAI